MNIPAFSKKFEITSGVVVVVVWFCVWFFLFVFFFFGGGGKMKQRFYCYIIWEEYSRLFGLSVAMFNNFAHYLISWTLRKSHFRPNTTLMDPI